MEVTAILGLLTLLVGVPLNAFVSFLLWRVSRRGGRLLRERAVVSFLLTVAMLVFGLIFVNNDQGIPPIDDVTTKYITRIVFLVLAFVPALAWLRIYRGKHK